MSFDVCCIDALFLFVKVYAIEDILLNFIVCFSFMHLFVVCAYLSPSISNVVCLFLLILMTFNDTRNVKL